MSRQYSAQEKQVVLQHLAANGYDIQLTSTQTGVSQRTVLRWRAKYLPPSPPPFQGTFSLANPTAVTPVTPLPANEIQAFRDLKRQLMNQVNRLSHSIDEAIDEAPLAQRAAALSQLIDRVMKISAQLPPNPQDYSFDNVEGEEPNGDTQSARSTSQTDGDSHI